MFDLDEKINFWYNFYNLQFDLSTLYFPGYKIFSILNTNFPSNSYSSSDKNYRFKVILYKEYLNLDTVLKI